MTLLPPLAGPALSDSFPTVGASWNVNRSAAFGGLVPEGVVTVTSTAPCPGGAVAVIDVGESTLKLAACAVPKRTDVASSKLSPAIVTVVPPPAGPREGLIDVTVGIGSPKASMCERPTEMLAALDSPATVTGTSLTAVGHAVAEDAGGVAAPRHHLS